MLSPTSFRMGTAFILRFAPAAPNSDDIVTGSRERKTANIRSANIRIFRWQMPERRRRGRRLKKGLNPTGVRKVEKQASHAEDQITFKLVAQEWLERKKQTWAKGTYDQNEHFLSVRRRPRRPQSETPALARRILPAMSGCWGGVVRPP